LALAYSGGGDSTALLHILRARAADCYVFIVDHALRADSRNEAETARAFAQSLGFETKVLKWEHAEITSGLQEKARLARYALIGKACRAEGFSYVVTGHTQNDQAETCLMRYDRGTAWRGAAGMAQQAPHPIWPELAGVTVLRPLLGVSRETLRAYNAAHQLPFVDDPSNANTAFARIRARRFLAARPALVDDFLATSKDLQEGLKAERELFANFTAQHVSDEDMGYLHLTELPPKNLLGQLLRAVSGQGRPIDHCKLAAFAQAARQDGFRAATLAGAKLTKTGEGFLLTRDLAAVKGRHGQAALKREPIVADGIARLWDGRFWISTMQTGLYISPLYGHMKAVPKRFEAAVKAVPAEARPCLPVIWQAGDILAIGHLKDSIRLASAITPRLRASLS